ncbi:hypothetical protein DYB32_006515 [Aphanomyces invadans]|uniref:Uncharacterized protein n=1 Tax=Aphanomyces invadans TaxID=157072 RepID=A0A3R7CY32_9STRA|nr:hypothetical protein DYB32_006515 [Aphanomyces invadans]
MADNEEISTNQLSVQTLDNASYTNSPLPNQATIPSEAPTHGVAEALTTRGSFVTHTEEDDEEDDEDEDEEEDEDEDNLYYDSGDEGDDGEGRIGRFGALQVPPMASRIKVTPSIDINGNKEHRFWVSFDNAVMKKSMIGRR